MLRFGPNSITAFGALAVAVSAGQFMQAGQDYERLESRITLVQTVQAEQPVTPSPQVAPPLFSQLEAVALSAEVKPAHAAVLAPAQSDVVLAQVQTDVALPVVPVAPLAARVGALADSGAASIAENTAPTGTFGLPCDATMVAKPNMAATVELQIEAACKPNMRVEIMHDRMRFADSTGLTGTLTLTVPALTRDATFIARFDDGDVLVALARVPDIDQFDRIALQWEGQSGLSLHAIEADTAVFDDGHVWAGNPRDLMAGATAKGGFLSVLGDAEADTPLMAEVYSYPKTEDRDLGVVRVNIEAEVTADNCTREVLAETLQPGFDGTLQAADLSLTMPDCTTVGEFLVLKNVVRDLKLASN